MGFARPATPSEVRHLTRAGKIFPSFVTKTAGRDRLVVDYKRANECLEARTFRMDQISDLASVLQKGDCLFKADIKDAYYHLRLRKEDQLRLAFFVGDRVYVPLCLNCGLAVAPWFFTKAMAPVVGFLRRLGHRVFSYLDDFFGAAKPAPGGSVAGPSDTLALGRLMRLLFDKLGLQLHPKKCLFDGTPHLEVLGILIDTQAEMFLLPPHKLAALERSAASLLRYAAQHRRFVKRKAVERFAGLANAAGPAVVDARLRLRELFFALSHAEVSGSHSSRPRPRDPHLSHAAMRDLQWWARLGCNPHVGRAIWPHPEAALFTDASMSGWGLHGKGPCPRLASSAKKRRAHISTSSN